MRPIDQRRRDELVVAALDYLARGGLAGFSLRGLASELHTSARMLVHYFGTKEELLARVLAEHRRQLLDAILTEADGDLVRGAERSWRTLSDPGRRGHYAVMFQVMAASLAEGRPYREVARRSVLDWVEAVTARLVEHGHEPADAARDATVLASGLKGIALDLMITDDRARCEAAATMLITVMTRPRR